MGGRLPHVFTYNTSAGEPVYFDIEGEAGDNSQVRPNLSLADPSGGGNSIIRSPHRVLSGIGSPLGIMGSGDGCAKGQEAKASTKDPENGLVLSKVDRCRGGICRTSLLYKIVCLQTVLLCALAAGYGAVKALPPREAIDNRWLAFSAAGAVIGIYVLFLGIPGKLWLPGLQ